jgi:glycosyltransferase involved in cell wall biosynthesis
LADQAIERGFQPEDRLRLATRNPVQIGLDLYRLRQVLLKEKPDILHLHLSADHWIGAIAARQTSTRVIRTIHHPDTLLPKPLRRWLFESMTDGFVVLRDQDRKDLLGRYRLSDKPIAVVHGAVDTKRFHPDLDTRPIRAEFGIGASTPVVGMVARLQPHRRHEEMLSAMVQLKKILPTLRMLVVGRGEHLPVLQDLVRKLDLEHHVIFTGYRDRDLPNVYAAMDVKVFLAGGSDISCRAVLEAMACGLPVVAYPVGALPETVVNGVTGYLVPEGDTAQLVQRIGELLSDRGKARKMGESARLRIEEGFTEEHRAQQTEEFYRSLMRAGHGAD